MNDSPRQNPAYRTSNIFLEEAHTMETLLTFVSLYFAVGVALGLYKAMQFIIQHKENATFRGVFLQGFFTVFVWPWMITPWQILDSSFQETASETVKERK